MAHSTKVIKAMEEFSDMMFKLYEDAGGLRDCTDNHEEKQIFNDTRNALYELKYKARKLYHKWESESKKS
jgi:hypothetical protein